MIQLINIKKSYKNSGTVLSDISLSFQQPSLNLIIGKSGSGKTTLLNIIAGLDSYDDGDLIYDDIKITKSNIDEYRNENIGFVFQQMNLIDSLSIKENLEIVFDMCHKKMEDEVILKLFNKVGLLENSNSLNEFLKKKPNQLSVGQMQRVAIVRALIKNPKIIILDEPTSALDEENSKKIVDFLKKLSKSIIVIIASHDKKIFTEVADQIIELKENKALVISKNEQRDSNNEEKRTFKKGFLSFHKTLKLAIINLKNKKIRLITSFILSTLTSILLSIAFTFQTCDSTKALLQTQIKNNEKIAFISNYLIYQDHNSYFNSTKKEPFTNTQIDRIKKYTEGNNYPVIHLTYNDRELFSELINGKDVKEDSLAYMFYFNSSSGIEIDSSNINDVGLVRYSKLKEKTDCRMPINYDEIAINSMMAEYILKYGLIQEVNEQHSVTKDYKPTSIDEIIGLKTYQGLTIVGIYSSTDGSEEFFKKHLFEDPNFKNEEEYEYYNNMRNGSSISQYVYLKPGFSVNNTSIKTDNDSSKYCIKLKGYLYSDYKFISSLASEHHKILFENRYTGRTNILNAFSDQIKIIAWTSIVILIFISLVVSLSLFYANVKSMEKDLGILKAIGVSKISISLIILTQTFVISFIEFLLTILCLSVIFTMLNSYIKITLFILSFALVGTLFLVLIISSFIISILSSRKAINGRAVNIIDNK